MEVRAPVETVNDVTIAILRWLVDNGSVVDEGTPLVLVETTKTTFDIASPARGFVWQMAEAGSEVPVGSILCYVGKDLERLKTSAAADRTTGQEGTAERAEPGERAAPPQWVAPVATAPSPALNDVLGARNTADTSLNDKPARFSGKARALLQQLGLDPSAFAGRGLVAERDVLAYAEGQAAATRPLPEAERRQALNGPPVRDPG